MTLSVSSLRGLWWIEHWQSVVPNSKQTVARGLVCHDLLIVWIVFNLNFKVVFMFARFGRWRKNNANCLQCLQEKDKMPLQTPKLPLGSFPYFLLLHSFTCPSWFEHNFCTEMSFPRRSVWHHDTLASGQRREDKDWSPLPDRWSPGPAHYNYSAEFGCCQSSFDSSWTDLNKTATLTNHIGRRWAKALTTNNGFWQARWNGIAKWRHRKIFYIHRETASCSHQEQASTKREKAKGRKELFVSLYHIHVIVIFAIDSSRLRKHGKVQRQLEIFLRGRLLDESRPLYCLSSSLKTPHPSCLYNFEPLISWENLWKMIMSRKVVKNH